MKHVYNSLPKAIISADEHLFLRIAPEMQERTKYLVSSKRGVFIYTKEREWYQIVYSDLIVIKCRKVLEEITSLIPKDLPRNYIPRGAR